jgi:hypothetical protein
LARGHVRNTWGYLKQIPESRFLRGRFMMGEMEIGQKGEEEMVVGPQDLASVMGNIGSRFSPHIVSFF